jgi:hypothetical protein
MEHKTCVLSAKLHKHYAFHEDWIWLDSEKDVSFSSQTCVNSEHATCGVFCIDELCDDGVGGCNPRKGKREANVTLNL